jgi:hypothetical protein
MSVETDADQASDDLIKLLWQLTDDSSENAQTGEVTIELTKEQASRMYNLFWRIGGEYRLGLQEHGWTPPRRRKS